jgi:hypothetical protein
MIGTRTQWEGGRQGIEFVLVGRPMVDVGGSLAVQRELDSSPAQTDSIAVTGRRGHGERRLRRGSDLRREIFLHSRVPHGDGAERRVD